MIIHFARLIRFHVTSLCIVLSLSIASWSPFVDTSIAQDGKSTTEPTAKTPDETLLDAKPAPNRVKELEQQQRQLSIRFGKLEELFIRMSELEAAANPTRAGLLMQAAQMSKQLATQQRLNLASDLLAKGQYSRAIQEQEASRENLKKLLELLQSENRSSRLRDERARLEDVLKDIRRIESIQRAIRGRTEAGQDSEQAATDQKDITDQVDKIDNDLKDPNSKEDESSSDKNKSDKPNSDKSDSDKSNSDKAENADKSESKDSPSKESSESKESKPNDADSKNQENENKSDSKSDPKQGDDTDKGKASDADPKMKEQDPSQKSDDPKSSDPKSTDPKSEDQKSQDSKSEDSKSSDQDSKSKESKSKEQQSQQQQSKSDQKESDEESDSESSESEKQDPSKPQSREEQARKRVQAAKKRMQKAEDKLKKEQRKDAVEEQRAAEEELQKAVVELERILRQLREEEIERALVDLETRLRKMADLERSVRDQTERLANLEGDAKDRQLEIQANKLSIEQSKVVMEGQRALLLLQDEGSSMAFPEALEQVNRDAQLVAKRLTEANVSASTQAIEDEILGALDEMLESLKQVQKKRDENKKQQQQQQQQQQNGEQEDQPLVDSIAELKLIKTLQLRVNRRTQRLATDSKTEEDLIGEIADPALNEEMRDLAQRQQKIHEVTRDILLEAKKD